MNPRHFRSHLLLLGVFGVASCVGLAPLVDRQATAPDLPGFGVVQMTVTTNVPGGRQIALGDLLLRARRYSEAEAAFRADLALQPGNGWELRGLQLAVAAQNRGAEAQQVQAEWARAGQSADLALRPAPRS